MEKGLRKLFTLILDNFEDGVKRNFLPVSPIMADGQQVTSKLHYSTVKKVPIRETLNYVDLFISYRVLLTQKVQ